MAIDNVCIDMSPAFISGTTAILLNSKITFDKFYVVQHLNKALDTVRRDERKELEYLNMIRLISENLNLITHLKRHRTIIFTKEKYTNQKILFTNIQLERVFLFILKVLYAMFFIKTVK